MSGSIKMPAAVAGWLLRGALAAASKDDVTPILTAIQWTVENGRATVTSTDRYRVHQLHTKELIGDDVADEPAEGTFLMTGAQARLLVKSLPRRNALALVELTWTDAEPMPEGFTGRIPRRYNGTLRFDIADHDGDDAEHLIHDGLQERGKFPPVARLFPDEADLKGDPAPQTAFMPEYLSDLRWLRSGYGSLRFVTPRATAQEKLAPMLVVNTEGTARALVQSAVLFDSMKRYGE